MSSLLTRQVTAALLLGAAAPALAGAGDGIRIGGSDGRMHPYLEIEGRYDSNVYVNVVPNTTAGDFIIHLRPGLRLEIPAELVAVDFDGKLDWAKYLGTDNADTKKLTKLYGEAKLGVGVNRKGTVGLELADTFRRSENPQVLSFGSGIISNYNAVDLSLPWRPGGGALTLTVDGNWALETFESIFSGFPCDPAVSALCDSSQLSKLGYNTLGAGADLKWRFLPRTSALLEGSFFKRIPNDKAFGNEGGGFRVATGVTGLVTPHVAATLKAGYGATTSVTPSLGTFLALAEAEWLPSETVSVKLSYAHDFAVDPQAVYDTNRVALDGRVLVGGRLGLRLHAGWDHLGYVGGPATTDQEQVSPAIDYELTRWLRGELGYTYTKRASSKLGLTTVPIVDYSKSEGWAKLVVTY